MFLCRNTILQQGFLWGGGGLRSKNGSLSLDELGSWKNGSDGFGFPLQFGSWASSNTSRKKALGDLNAQDLSASQHIQDHLHPR